jgi:BlaI family penicillinase repressor
MPIGTNDHCSLLNLLWIICLDEVYDIETAQSCEAALAGNFRKTNFVVALPRWIGDMNKTRLSKAETRILEQFWKLGTCSVREILDSLPEEERVAYTTVQTLVYRLEQKGALRKVKKIGNAQLFEPAIDQNEYRSGLVRDLLDLFGGSPRILVSNLLETGTITLKDLKALQNAAPGNKNSPSRGGKDHA